MRASDDKRERVVRLLGRRFAEGYLSTDTFEARAAVAYSSRDAHELEPLVRDLPAAGLRASLLRALLRLRDGGRGEPPPLEIHEPPPEEPARTLVIGRHPGCDLVLEHPTVSRRHAQLTRDGDRWVLTDLSSSNGTRLNGWRVRRSAVRSGDELMLGAQRLLFAPDRGD